MQLTQRQRLESKVVGKLVPLLEASNREYQASPVCKAFLKAHDIEFYPSILSTSQASKPCENGDLALNFASPAGTDPILEVMRAKRRRMALSGDKETQWVPTDPEFVDRTGYYYIAHHISRGLLHHQHNVDWEMKSAGWRDTEGPAKYLPFYSDPGDPKLDDGFQTHGIFRTTDKNKPHLATSLVTGAPPQIALRHIELLCAVRMIFSSIMLDKQQNNMVHPVFVWSVSRTNFRVIQAYFDYLKDVLIISTTPYTDVSEGKEEDIARCLQWMVSSPSGETKSLADDLTVTSDGSDHVAGTMVSESNGELEALNDIYDSSSNNGSAGSG